VVAYAALAVLAWRHRRLRWPVLAGAILVILGTGFGRVYLGVHWPSDVLAGYMLGALWVSLGIAASATVAHLGVHPAQGATAGIRNLRR
jgi:undecaprenyl-diphosphatase